ncbi:alpha/beta hydrolase family protein [Hydrogenophaga taeniospiralis]|uniref:alpha/beta hydrolase family protein n=1 Tax=Hydrogenophaga taeniospiralis TaxID=65656 RepID=UPI001CFB8CDE|nr:dienelactone hydrolase [Hydrogenophaga taeniospiralis]
MKAPPVSGRRQPTAWLAALALAGLGLLLATPARAATGLTELPGQAGDGPVTVFYPSSASEQPLQRGPFTLKLAWQGEPVRGNARLVVISHGSGGNPWVHADLAGALVKAGFVVAVPQHRGDHTGGFTDPGPTSWKRRPGEVSRAIDALAQSPRFAPLLALDWVGVYGGSAGGHTALTLAGGRWSATRFRDHCEAHIAEDFPSCVGFTTRLRGDVLDPLKLSLARAVIRWRFDDVSWHSHHDPRIQAAVASVPFAADFDLDSLRAPRIALGLVVAGRDVNQLPRFHVGAVRAACGPCVVIADLPEAGHGAMLSPLPPFPPGSLEHDLLGDPPGFDRAVLPEVDRQIAGFFRQHLLAPP